MRERGATTILRALSALYSPRLILCLRASEEEEGEKATFIFAPAKSSSSFLRAASDSAVKVVSQRDDDELVGGGGLSGWQEGTRNAFAIPFSIVDVDD